MPRKWFEFEREAAAVRQFDKTLLDIDRKFDARMFKQITVLAFTEHDRQQSVLQCIATEDVGDLASQHRVDSIVEQRPGRVFARGTATEVATGHKNFAAARLGF